MALRDIPLSICTGPKKPEMGPYFFTDAIATFRGVLLFFNTSIIFKGNVVQKLGYPFLFLFSSAY